MGFIKDPNAGPSQKVAGPAILYDGAAAATVMTKTMVLSSRTSGVGFRIQCDQNGTYHVHYIDRHGTIRLLLGNSAYNANAGLVEVEIEGLAEQTCIEFTPNSPATNLFIEGFKTGISVDV